jgi:hypothetical protein
MPRALAWKRWANLRFSPLLAATTNKSSGFSELMTGHFITEIELCLISV